MATRNHITPPYYKANEHECIEEIRAMLTPEEFRGFIKGNILKYRYRQNYKGDPEADKRKADDYMDLLIHM